jgi:hypothetical protein
MASPKRCGCDFGIYKLKERRTGHINDGGLGHIQDLRVQTRRSEYGCDEKTDYRCSMYAVDKKHRFLVRLCGFNSRAQ